MTQPVTFDVNPMLKKVDMIKQVQIPFASSLALNNLAKEVRDNYRSEMKQRFRNPVPFTLNGMYIKASTKSNLYVEVGLKEFATSKTGFMQESNPAEYDSMMKDMDKTLEEYRAKLNKTMPEGPYQFEESELAENLSQPYIRAVMSSNYGRSKMPQALVEAFDAIKENEKFTKNMYEEKSFEDFMK